MENPEIVFGCREWEWDYYGNVCFAGRVEKG
jgi:hypothetical protein